MLWQKWQRLTSRTKHIKRARELVYTLLHANQRGSAHDPLRSQVSKEAQGFVLCDTETIRASAQHRDTVEKIPACQLMMKFNFTFPLKAEVFHSLLSSNSLEVGSQRGAGILSKPLILAPSTSVQFGIDNFSSSTKVNRLYWGKEDGWPTFVTHLVAGAEMEQREEVGEAEGNMGLDRRVIAWQKNLKFTPTQLSVKKTVRWHKIRQ